MKLGRQSKANPYKAIWGWNGSLNRFACTVGGLLQPMPRKCNVWDFLHGGLVSCATGRAFLPGSDGTLLHPPRRRHYVGQTQAPNAHFQKHICS